MHRTNHWLENGVGPPVNQEQVLLSSSHAACWKSAHAGVCLCGAESKQCFSHVFLCVWLRSPLVNLRLDMRNRHGIL